MPADNEFGKVDVLLITNADDGMYKIIPPDKPYDWGNAMAYDWDYFRTEPHNTWESVRTAKWSMQMVDTRSDRTDDEEPQKKFAFIERYAERIWGGGCKNEPDTLYYSRAFNPTDWTKYDPDTDADPADAAGEIQQPSWDGDSFTALRRFGEGLVAFKNRRIWRITGTDPSNYMFSEQFGDGCPYPHTIAVDGERILFAGEDGLCVYDGSNLQPFMRQYIEKTWQSMKDQNAAPTSGLMFKDRYYLTIGRDLLIYNKEDNSFLKRSVKVEHICVFHGNVIGQSFIPGIRNIDGFVIPPKNEYSKIMYDSWGTGKVDSLKSNWISPWMDFSYKRIAKGGFDLYFTPEVKDRAVTFTFRIRTEKKLKEKQYTVNPMTPLEKANGKLLKPKKLHFSGTGRRFRVEIEVWNPNVAPWRLLGGLHLVVETDSD